ncbi:MAG: biotin/lipoyl-binding protein, partial [candidate division Zixibacteria bacterium]|nr:biotin/lipoyl-binding protein [candidate division Zixibacteria bacterium]
MKKLIWIIVIIVIIAGVAYVVYPSADEEQNSFNPLERTEKVKRGDLVVTVSAVGTIEPQQAVEVKSKASGQIIKLYVDEGDKVIQGDLICVLDKTAAQNDYRQAEADLTVAQVTLKQA